MAALVFAVLGGAWRWWDGRGYGPGWFRIGFCLALSTMALSNIGWLAIPLGALFSAVWTFRQKNREEWDDMALRWLLPFLVFGIVLGAVTGSVGSAAILSGVGAVVSVLVWAGTHVTMSRFDPAAVTDAAAGAVAFGGLALAAL